jgi:hypothetical protein
MRNSLQFALAAGSTFILSSAAMAQDATVRLSPLFQVQPLIAQEYAPYSVLPSMNWRAPVFPQTWDMQAVAPFTLEVERPFDGASNPPGTPGYSPIVDSFRLLPPISQPAPTPPTTTGQGQPR